MSHEHNADTGSLADPAAPDKKEHGHGHSHDHSGENHALIVCLGTVTLGGATFAIDRDGQVEAGKVTEFGVERVGGSESVTPSSAWLANPDGTKTADPVNPDGHLNHWHFNLEPDVPVKKSSFILKVGDEEATIDVARGAAPCNGGILSVLKADGVPCGFLELKLHGDAGDLELFLYDKYNKNSFGHTAGKPVPLDIPGETVLNLTFPTHENKAISLAVRDMDKNEDEDGTPNMRPSGTNYFIFPGESGQDPAWLVGETVTSWRGTVTVAFQANGKSYTADPFVLVPHDAL